MYATLTADRCFGAASAKKRLDVVIRDAINAGDIPGPRYLANGMEIARRDGELVGGITAFADGPDEMRKVIREHVDLGVDNIKLSMSGEEVSATSYIRHSFAQHADSLQTDHRDSIGP
jgi:imidazolonepropionase-like amidohydrolase